MDYCYNCSDCNNNAMMRLKIYLRYFPFSIMYKLYMANYYYSVLI